MLNLMIAYANSAADRWAAWIVAASLDAARAARAGRPGVARHPQVGSRRRSATALPPGPAQAAGARGRDRPGRHGAMDSFGPDLVVVRRGPRPERIESRPPVETPIAADAGRAAAARARGSATASAVSRQPMTSSGPRSERRRTRGRCPGSSRCRGPCPVGAGRIPDRLAGRRLAAPRAARRARSCDFARGSGSIARSMSRGWPSTSASCAAAPESAETIRIVEDDSVAVPAVWGIARPTIILPRGIAVVLTAGATALGPAPRAGPCPAP